MAWYPIYRIPHGKFRAAFLTYHSLGQFVQSTACTGTCDTKQIISPAVGMQSYNTKVCDIRVKLFLRYFNVA